jgi:hypothetical protein
MKFASLAFRFAAVALLAVVLMGCATQTVVPILPTVQPTVDLQPTLNAVQTQAAQTVIANLTKNAPTAAPVKPTNTLAPTATAAPTATQAPTSAPATAAPTAAPTTAPSATAGVKLWTLTPTLSTYNCVVLSATPLKSAVLAPYQDFDGVWTLLNSGSEMWNNADLDIIYRSGTRMQKKADVNEVSFTTNVLHNEQYTVIVDMRAPAEAGVYTTTWAIVRGSRDVCTLNVTVTVK